MQFTKVLKIKAGVLLTLFLILVGPIIVIALYQSTYLSVVKNDSNFQRVDGLIQKVNHQISILQRQIVRKLDDLFEGRGQINQTERIAFRESIINQTRQRQWLGGPSNFKKIRILSVMVSSNQMDSLQRIERQVMLGLEWFVKEYQMNIKIIKWFNELDLNDVMEVSLVVIFQQLKYEFIQENIANRLRKGEYRNEFYIQEIVHQLRSTALFSHCKYTNVACEQKSIMVLSPLVKQSSYLSVEKEIFLMDRFDHSILFNVLAEIFQVKELLRIKNMLNVKGQNISNIYHLTNNISYLYQALNMLRYIKYISIGVPNIFLEIQQKMEESGEELYKYLMNGRYLSPYIHDQEESVLIQQYLNHVQKQLRNQKQKDLLEVNLLSDTRIGRIDYFPNNFKVGIYLPLTILFLYPLLIKSKDAIIFVLKGLRQTLFGSKTTKDENKKQE